MKTRKRDMIVRMLIIDVIILWPLFNSFFGIDMVDTGYYLYQYENPLSPNIPYTYYLAIIIGAVWNKVFGFFGIWGLNILEILMEYLLCFIVYKILHPIFGKKQTLLGILICMLAISTYVNIFNYHQLNMFFCTILTLFMLKGLREEKKIWIFAAGCSGMLAIASRMPSVLTLCCVFVIVYWMIIYKKTIKIMFQNIVAFLGGYAVIGIIYIIILKMAGVLDTVIGEIFRLNSLGKSSSSTYGSSSMITNFINDTLNGIESALVFLASVFCVYIMYEYYIIRKEKIQSKILGFVGCIIGIAGMFVSVYLIADAPPYVQLTSFSWFLYGILFTIGAFYIIKGLFAKTKREKFDGLVMFLSEALILLCFVGSAARAKHAIMGMWIILPFLIHKVSVYIRRRKSHKVHVGKKKTLTFSYQSGKATIIIVALVLVIVFTRFLSVTNNFDSPNRLALNASVDNKKLEFVFTTKRQAKAMNEVLDVVEKNASDDTTLMIVGNSLIFYYLTDMTPYVRTWVTGSSYMIDTLREDLNTQQNSGTPLPIIIEAKTNTYEGFSEEKYQALAEQIKKSKYGDKGQLIAEFRNNYNYNLIYENDYFYIYYVK